MIDGATVLSQSMTICRFLAEKFDLAGSDSFIRARASEEVDHIIDLSNSKIVLLIRKIYLLNSILLEFIPIVFQKDREERAKNLANFSGDILSIHLNGMSKAQTENGGYYLAGNEV